MMPRLQKPGCNDVVALDTTQWLMSQSSPTHDIKEAKRAFKDSTGQDATQICFSGYDANALAGHPEYLDALIEFCPEKLPYGPKGLAPVIFGLEVIIEP